MSTLTLQLYTALRQANVEDATARNVAEELDKAIDARYKLHADQLATRGDLKELAQNMAEMETRLTRTMLEMQRWTIGVVVACVSVAVAAIKIL